MSQDYGPPAAPTSRPWPAAVPLVWAAAIFAAMSPDAIVGRPDVPAALKWLVYDESDLTALALRGANASMGRLPGRADEPKEPDWTIPPETLPKRLDAPDPPYSERFYLEYPTPALGLFWLGFAGRPADLPAAVADAHQFSVAFFAPRDAAERAVWTRLGRAVRCYVAVMALGLAGLIVVLGRFPVGCGGLGWVTRSASDRADSRSESATLADRPGTAMGRGPGPVWLCALPGAVFFALNRFDVLPALATALAFAALGRGRRGWAGAWLAAGVLLKLYPVLFVPVILRHLGPRPSVRFLVGFAGVAASGVGLSWAATDWQGVVGPIRVQLNRPLEANNWILYGRLLPLSLGHSKEGRLLLLAATVLAVSATRPAGVPGVLRRCALVLIVFTNLSVFWSPQWVVWFLPLLVPVAAGRRGLTATAVALDAVSYFSFPVLFWILWGQLRPDAASVVVEGTIAVRTALWLTLAVLLVRDERRAKADDPARFRARLGEYVEAFRRAGAASGKPRGLAWVSAEPAGDPLFVRDGGRLVALVQVIVRFEPTPGSELEDVPQAREPRPVTAMFVADGGWRTDGRAVFNLSPAEVVSRSGGRFRIETRRQGEGETGR
jgi:hypothetical protein